MKKLFTLLLLVCLPFCAFAADVTRIRCASTTSTQNSGLFDHVLPLFEKKMGIKVDVVAVGTGAAIEIGKRGDADIVFVHAKELELKAVEEGYFVDRHDVMYNDFIVIGPNNDKAGIKNMKSATDAFRKIAEMKSPFVSRGDNSGTNMKELSIWKNAAIDPKGQEWYLEVGQGMAKTQRIASEKQAYELTDRGTWLSLKDKYRLDLTILLEGDPILFNQYGIMIVNPEKHSHVQYKKAKQFVDWIISKDGQEAIASFRDMAGNSLFVPNAK